MNILSTLSSFIMQTLIHFNIRSGLNREIVLIVYSNRAKFAFDIREIGCGNVVKVFEIWVISRIL